MGFLINDELRSILKVPLGELFHNFKDAIEIITSSKFLISVGDATTKNLLDHEILPNLAIIDNRIQRKDHDFEFFHTKNIFNVNNPQGTISDELWETISSVINNKDNHKMIVVKGEEDLAVLPCILMAPPNSMILYGQPNEGLVIVNPDDIKDTAVSYLEKFDKINTHIL